MSIQIQPATKESKVYLLEERRQILAEQLRRAENKLNMARYRRRPDLWLSERFAEDPKSVIWSDWPGYDGHVWDGDENPLFKAWMAIAGDYWAALESATGTGKTYILARIVFWFLDVFENSLVVTSAPKKDQLDKQLWSEISRAFEKFKRIRPYAELTYLKLRVDARRSGLSEGDSNSWMAIGFVAGIKANEESTTKAQGFHREHMLIITEETPGMPIPTMTAFENTSTGSFNKILAVGNPDSVVDTLSQFSEGPNVVKIRASAYDHPNIVNNREFIPGAVSVNSINIRKAKYGEESGFFKSRVRGIAPQQGVNSLIMYKWIVSCWLQYEKFHELEPIYLDENSYNALAVDVANSENGDAAAEAWGEKNILRRLREFTCPNASDLAYNFFLSDELLEEQRHENYGTGKLWEFDVEDFSTGVDAIGVGVATVNAFRYEGYEVIALQGGQLDEAIPLDAEDKPLYDFGGLRSQMYFELREDFQHRNIALDIKDKKLFFALAKELVLPTYTTKGGKIQVEHKESIKKRLGGKSPNLADVVAYWNWMRKGHYRNKTTALPLSTKKRK